LYLFVLNIRETMADADTSAEGIAALQSVEGEAIQRMFQRIAASVETNNE
jgi:hypothetical protein